MEQKGKESVRSRQADTSTERKIRIIRIVLLAIFLFIWSDAIARWFSPAGELAPGMFRAIVWLVCLASAAVLFFSMRKPEKPVFKWTLSILYLLVLVLLLKLCGFYSYQASGTVGYKITLTFMPVMGMLVEHLHPRFIKWYGNGLKRIFKLDGIRNVTFGLGMLLFYALVVTVSIGLYHIPGWLSGWGKDVSQLVTEGEINRNSDHREPSRRYSSIFSDLNDVQLEAAKSNGLKTFLDFDEARRSSQLREIESCDLYYVQDLTHSIPYLVPKAKDLLEDMGRAFQDSLYNRGYNRDHRITVTSVLRTPESVKKLQKTNVNSSSNSCHCYGTTIDISYRTFQTPSRGKTASVDKMNQVLMQVAYDMRSQGRCYVKYEKQQTCLHITVR